MTPYYSDPLVRLILGDCIEVLPTLEAESVDAVVTDPPYGLEFMGKEWDRPQLDPMPDCVACQQARGRRCSLHLTYGGRGGNPFDAGGEGFRKGSSKRFQNSPPLPTTGERKAIPKCRKCGKWKYNGWKPRQCSCEEPDFEERSSVAYPRRMQAWHEQWAVEALRVTKPGGYLLAFGGTRTHHRLVCALEDAGWIIRDELDWIYASGFPKGKANLKPAHEPIVLARKPGKLRPLGIDECRIGTFRDGEYPTHTTAIGGSNNNWENARGEDGKPIYVPVEAPSGRWPSNVLLSDPELFDEPNDYVVGSGATTTSGVPGTRQQPHDPAIFGGIGMLGEPESGYGDSGGYSRFFIIPKADRAERERGLAGRPQGFAPTMNDGIGGREHSPDDPRAYRANVHPTVKPIDLMRHLVRLVTPPTVNVLECRNCDSRVDAGPNLPQVRGEVPPPQVPDVLLEHLSSEVATESPDPMPDMRDAVPGEGGVDRSQAEVLLEGLREQGTDGPSGPVRGVRDTLPPEESRQAVLLADMLGAGERPQASGVDEESGGLHPRVEPGASERSEVGIRDAASPDHGGRARATANGRRGSRSHQRDQGRQPAGEPASPDPQGPQQPAEAATQADHLPSLSVDDPDLGTCAACGGSLTARTRPGVVLDPFLGSGTTSLACSEEGFRCIGIERELEYLEIAKGRLMATPMGLGLDVPAPTRKRMIGEGTYTPGRAYSQGSAVPLGLGTDEEPAA